MWRYLACSVAGPVHHGEVDACQDRREVRLMGDESHPVLLACVADGAGSAIHGGEGAAIACRVIADHMTEHFEIHRACETLQRADVSRWCDDVRQQIHSAGRERASPMRQFATTLCAAVVAPQDALFFQIGDGAIVLRRNGVFGAVFWPQSGEFANSTNFLTADDYDEHLEFCYVHTTIDDVALVTDGLERMTLCFESRVPFPPFFQPIFDAIRQSSDMRNLNDEMQQFLLSNPVRDRSDDDKTIIIATRSA